MSSGSRRPATRLRLVGDEPKPSATSTPRRIALVAMPWPFKDRPSAALAALAAYVRRARPDDQIDTFHEFVKFAVRIGAPLYDAIADTSPYEVGELVYLANFYPEKRADARRQLVRLAENGFATRVFDGLAIGSDKQAAIDSLKAISTDWSATFDALEQHVADHIASLSEELAGYDVVGMTTCFGQLYANLALARAIKARAPSVRIVLGGSTLSGRVGVSMLGEYDFIDYIVQGEGERPMLALLDNLERPDAIAQLPGVLCRENVDERPNGASFWEVERMDDLPTPDFDDYARFADEAGVGWVLPLEGSRGCWWDRTKRSGNPKATCYFCSLNSQWNGYRQKSESRLVEEVRELTEKHQVLRLFFLDNIMRHHGASELAGQLKDLGRELSFFYEFRANLPSHELLSLWEAGLDEAQFGIEGLSNDYLQRIGKGTSVIRNLSVMKVCAELGIKMDGNLITGFPGGTAEEVEETRRTILDYALGYEPLRAAFYVLGRESTVEVLRDEFGLVNVRNRDTYKHGMPEDVWNRVAMVDLDYDLAAPPADWGPVHQALATWQDLYRQRRSKAPALTYQDGGTFITITDDRFGDHREGVFDGVTRDIYMYCHEIRTLDVLRARFCATGELTEAELEEELESFVANRLMYREQEKYLALACATRPDFAARRIRSQGPAAKRASKRAVESAPDAL